MNDAAPARRLRFAARYFALQAAATAAWWVVLLGAPAARDAFTPEGFPFAALAAFLLPDLAFLSLGGAVLARRLARGERSPVLLGAVAGAVGYATLYCLAATAASGGGAAASGLMVAAAAGTGLALRAVRRAGPA
jgi:hypothetical protein